MSRIPTIQETMQTWLRQIESGQVDYFLAGYALAQKIVDEDSGGTPRELILEKLTEESKGGRLGRYVKKFEDTPLTWLCEGVPDLEERPSE